MTRQVFSAGRRNDFLSLSEVRSLLNARVLEGRGDLSAWLIENQWSGSFLGDHWMLEISMPLEDEEGYHLLGILVPCGLSLSPTWECGSDMQEEFK